MSSRGVVLIAMVVGLTATILSAGRREPTEVHTIRTMSPAIGPT